MGSSSANLRGENSKNIFELPAASSGQVSGKPMICFAASSPLSWVRNSPRTHGSNNILRRKRRCAGTCGNKNAIEPIEIVAFSFMYTLKRRMILDETFKTAKMKTTPLIRDVFGLVKLHKSTAEIPNKGSQARKKKVTKKASWIDNYIEIAIYHITWYIHLHLVVFNCKIW